KVSQPPPAHCPSLLRFFQEDDEIDTLFNKNYRYYSRLFSHSGVLVVARDFATTLRMRRRLTAGEVFEQLSRLNSL
ncbi:MAG: hypothetical protein Q4C34_09425, partial [Bacteroidales bacterium]|nr:hypothetical protein [Bacteroidales bacterium]